MVHEDDNGYLHNELKKITFFKDLGDMEDKTIRVLKIARYLFNRQVSEIAYSPILIKRQAEKLKELGDDISQAALYCKVDIASQSVKNLPELQGYIGKHLAKVNGLKQAVCDAIEEHYWPKTANDKLPKNFISIIVGISDRIDTLVGFFSLGIKPTSKGDPYALRRCGNGLASLLLSNKIKRSNIDLKSLITLCVHLYNFEKLKNIYDDLEQFIKQRIQHILELRINKEKTAIEAINTHVNKINIKIKEELTVEKVTQWKNNKSGNYSCITP